MATGSRTIVGIFSLFLFSFAVWNSEWSDVSRCFPKRSFHWKKSNKVVKNRVGKIVNLKCDRYRKRIWKKLPVNWIRKLRILQFQDCVGWFKISQEEDLTERPLKARKKWPFLMTTSQADLERRERECVATKEE